MPSGKAVAALWPRWKRDEVFFEYFYRNKLLRGVCSLQPSGSLHRKMVTMCFLSNQLFKNKGHGLVLMFCFLMHRPFYSKLEVFLFVF